MTFADCIALFGLACLAVGFWGVCVELAAVKRRVASLEDARFLNQDGTIKWPH